MFQIPLKLKYRGTPGIYGHVRNHSGNGNKKKKKIGGSGYSDPYNRRDHVLILQTNGKKKFLHYDDARMALKD